MPALLAALAPPGVALATFVLQALLPGRTVPGYVMTERTRTPARSVYVLNGLVTCAVVVAAVVGALWVWPALAGTLVDHSGTSAASSCALGLAVSALFFVRGLRLKDVPQGSRCATVDFTPQEGGPDAAEFKVCVCACVCGRGVGRGVGPRGVGVGVGVGLAVSHPAVWLLAAGCG
jgi:hypothetical protein